jgi:glycosyltransferase involved in cell wall biosynthesis
VKIGLISGDGLPVSGLLTVFRNVFHLGRSMGLLDDVVVADLGYSWRSDKERFFPHGPNPYRYPPWLRPTTNDSIAESNWAALSAELEDIRRCVATFEILDTPERHSLAVRIEDLRKVYFDHFSTWLERHEPDWVFAMNLTLPHAVSVTSALYMAADLHYRSRPGGLVIWDHDLCGSNGRWDAAVNRRFYPSSPNDVTPLPPEAPHIKWIVVSEALAREAESYDTTAHPQVLANVLPRVPPGIAHHHREFARQLELNFELPTLVSPVRIYRVKGVSQTLRFHAEVVDECFRRSLPPPYLLVFGSLDEDPEYANELITLRDELATKEHVRFLGGVPLETMQEDNGDWRLDEVDLLRLARATHGGVVFTPSVSDFETVGLGPGLAAAAEIPAVSTRYNAFDEVYGAAGVTCTTFEPDGSGMTEAAAHFVDVLARFARHDADLIAELKRNRQAVESLFPVGPWRTLLDSMDGGPANSGYVSEERMM